jgi:hypothetical protein
LPGLAEACICQSHHGHAKTRACRRRELGEISKLRHGARPPGATLQRHLALLQHLRIADPGIGPARRIYPAMTALKLLGLGVDNLLSTHCYF